MASSSFQPQPQRESEADSTLDQSFQNGLHPTSVAAKLRVKGVWAADVDNLPILDQYIHLAEALNQPLTRAAGRLMVTRFLAVLVGRL